MMKKKPNKKIVSPSSFLPVFTSFIYALKTQTIGRAICFLDVSSLKTTKKNCTLHKINAAYLPIAGLIAINQVTLRSLIKRKMIS